MERVILAKKSCGARRQMVNASTWNGFVSLLQHFVGLFPVLVQPGLFSFYRLHRIRKRNIGCSLATKGRYCPVCEEGGAGGTDSGDRRRPYKSLGSGKD